MKNLALKFFAFALMVTPFLTSCDDDDNTSPEETDEVVALLEEGEMNGTLTEDYTLDASVSYDLTGSFIVEDGVTLTIPAGTQIVAEADGTDVYVAVMMGGSIDIQGTASSPVVMTSEDAKAGDWGGLTLCGKAVTTAGENAEAEVGGFIYGGTDDEDSSGSITYLVIKGTGAAINSESEYNGVSFYAVGSGTTLNNIAVINGKDDGVEFFGGTASITNLFLENNEDDAVDWTEGWSGGITNTYISHTISDFSTAFEGDKVNNNPTFTNVTCISTTGGIGLQFKKESGATITGLYMSGYEYELDMKDDGATSNVIVAGAAADVTSLEVTDKYYYSFNSGLEDAPTVDISDWTWVSTSLNAELNGNVIGDVTLDASVAYTLTGSYIVQDGATLTIPAGTKITAEAGGTGVYIAVLMGGTININGTADAPVVMSSVNAEPEDWGGLTLCGKATTTAGENAEAEVGGFIYGGTDDEDSSGSITYLVIKGTGAAINSESEYNGVSFYAVGSKTTLNNIAVINGADDGVEFFGGTAVVENLYLVDNEDDAVDWTEGWSGGITNTYIKHTISNFSTAFEGDKVNNNPTFTNVTCISETGGIGLQFKKESGATITGLYITGYDYELDMKDNGATSNVIVEGSAADVTSLEVTDKYYYSFNSGTQTAETVDVSGWSWVEATL